MGKKMQLFIAIVLVLPLVMAAPAAGDDDDAIVGDIELTNVFPHVCANGSTPNPISWLGPIYFDGESYGKAYFNTGLDVSGAPNVLFWEFWTIFRLPRGSMTMLEAACDPRRVVLSGQEYGFGVVGQYAWAEGLVTQVGRAAHRSDVLEDVRVGDTTYWYGTYGTDPAFGSTLWIYPADDDDQGGTVLGSPDGYYRGNAYELVTDSPTNSWVTAHFAAAERYVPGCEESHLATITSRGEQAVLAELMEFTDRNAYLGGFQQLFELRKARNWKWITGERWRYRNWAEDEPNDNPWGTYTPGSEQNLEAYPGEGLWNDVPEPESPEAPKYFVVEYEDCDFDDDDDDDDDDD